MENDIQAVSADHEFYPSPSLPSREGVVEFEALLEYLKRDYGFDFTGYKRASLVRRVERRLSALEIDGYQEYSDYLLRRPDEFSHLFNTILINETSFYRDRHAWDIIGEKVVPSIMAAKKGGESIRVWSACCSSGEEAYTLGMLLDAALGQEEFSNRVTIYATDVDDEALNQGRRASYSPRDVVGIPGEMLGRHFDECEGRFLVRDHLKRGVIFDRHNLIQDHAISDLDLIVCRNALMYFNAEVQAEIVPRLHTALNDGGFLFLGKAEALFTHADLFLPVDAKRRIFQKAAGKQ